MLLKLPTNFRILIHGLYYAFAIGVFSAALVDAYKYPESSRKLFDFWSRDLLFIFVIATILFRFLIGQPFQDKIRQILLRFALPFFALTSIILTIIDVFTPVNFTYSKFLINYDQVGLLAIALGIVLTLSTPTAAVKKHFQSILFYGAPIILSVLFLIRFWPMDFFFQIVKEDRFIENAQFVILAIGSVGSFAVSRLLHRRRRQYIATVFTAISLILFLVAGDEISWGQRIFQFDTPGSFQASNTQNEITFHNTYTVNGYVAWGYILIGFYGAYAWILPWLFPKFRNKFTAIFIPPWFLTWYFFAGFFYNSYTLVRTHAYGEWSEVAELMLYTGITLHVATVYFLLKKEKSLAAV